MTRRALLVLLVALLGCSTARTSRTNPAPFAILPATDEVAKAIQHLCSRVGVDPLDGLWVPSEAEVALVEARLERLRLVESDEGSGIIGARLEDPWAYYRQYVGVVVEGRKLIYINGFSGAIPDDRAMAEFPQDGRTEIVDGCDGDYGFWGVLYDPVRGTFYQLRFNGTA